MGRSATNLKFTEGHTAKGARHAVMDVMVAYYPNDGLFSCPVTSQGPGPASVVFSKADSANAMTTLGLIEAGWVMLIRLVCSSKYIRRGYAILHDNFLGVLPKVKQKPVLLRNRNIVLFHERDVR